MGRLGDDQHPAPERPALVLSGLAILTGLVVMALTGVPPVRAFVLRIDAAWLHAAVELERSGLVVLAEILAVIGGVYVTTPLRIAVGLLFAAQRHWWKLAAWVLAIATSEAATTVMKVAYGRQRPELTLEITRSAAFPSGHASAAAVTATTLVLLFTRPGVARRRWALVAAALVALMAASRVYLRVHWLSDVLMGTLVGMAAGLVAVGATAAIAERRRRRAVHQGLTVGGAGSAS
jgi:membrane-associated phospholipid phosphatase